MMSAAIGGSDTLIGMIGDARLTVEIKNEQPVELADFVKSFHSLGDEYQIFASRPENVRELPRSQDVRLYVREIRTSSIVVELMALGSLALPFMSDANTVLDFAVYMRMWYDYLLGKSKQKPVEQPVKRELENFANIVEPVAKDGAAQFNIHTFGNGNLVQVFTLNSVEANAAQNASRREIEGMKVATSGLHEKVLLYFYQARGDPTSATGDRAIVESISPKPVKVVYGSEAVKVTAVLIAQQNPFTTAYVVDLVVETIDGKPALYKILTIHDSFERPT